MSSHHVQALLFLLVLVCGLGFLSSITCSLLIRLGPCSPLIHQILFHYYLVINYTHGKEQRMECSASCIRIRHDEKLCRPGRQAEARQGEAALSGVSSVASQPASKWTAGQHASQINMLITQSRKQPQLFRTKSDYSSCYSFREASQSVSQLKFSPCSANQG